MTSNVTTVVVGLFVLAGALAPLGCSGADSETDASDDTALGQDESLLRPGREQDGSKKGCFIVTMGGPSSCKPEAVWKQYASDACEQKNTELVDINYAASCPKESFRFAKYECCPPSPPPPPPPPPSCEPRSLGGPSSCKDPATWKTYANDACVADGLKLGDVSLPDATCGRGGKTDAVKFTCCK